MKAVIAESKGREKHEDSLQPGESCLAHNPSFNLAMSDHALYIFNAWNRAVQARK